MTERKALSKKIRFEIFKRDRFTCQYCGKQPPDTILEIDHIMPVVGGGTNDMMNLVTSCFECNRGKGKRELGNVAPRPDADIAWLEAQQELAELQRYQEIKKELDSMYARTANCLQKTWMYAFQTDYAPREVDFFKLLKSVAPEIIERAIYIASAKEDLIGNTRDRFRYVCGITWNIIRRESDGE